jgi:predicted nucleic acid-binding Zn ribbon protein
VCKTASLTKLVSAAGFHLKGSGWYATDFKGSGKPAAAKAGGEAKPAAAGSESKDASTPATAPAAAPAGGSGS